MKKHANIYLRWLLVFMGSLTPGFSEEAQADRSQLEATISLEKPCYKPAEPIRLVFKLRNISHNSLIVSTRWSHPRQKAIKLVGPDGHTIPPRILPTLLPPTREEFVTIPKDGIYKDQLLIEQDTWNHATTGQYNVQVIYENQNCDFFDKVIGQGLGTLACWKGRLESNVVVFNISKHCSN